MTVGILSNDSFGRFAFPIVEALERRLFDHGIAVFMCNATDDPMRERRHIEQLLGKRVDGLVVTARRADRREPIEPVARGLPVVYVYSQVENPDALVPAAGRRGRREARGQPSRRSRPQEHRPYHRPGAVRGGSLARNGLSQRARRSGAEAAAGECRAGRWSEAWGREATQALFSQRRRPPDALFCGNDQIARGAVDALREMGLAVPADVAVVGFDNWDVMAEGGAAAAHQRRHESRRARSRGRRIASGDDGGPRFAGVRRLPCSLVIRDSCGAHARSSAAGELNA